jgi:hypothetical protein
MGEYAIGRQRTKRRQERGVVIHVSVKRRVYDRLCAMRDALEHEVGVPVTVPAVVRKILFQHPSLRKLAAHRDYPTPDSGDDVVR